MIKTPDRAKTQERSIESLRDSALKLVFICLECFVPLFVYLIILFANMNALQTSHIYIIQFSKITLYLCARQQNLTFCTFTS